MAIHVLHIRLSPCGSPFVGDMIQRCGGSIGSIVSIGSGGCIGSIGSIDSIGRSLANLPNAKGDNRFYSIDE